MQFGNEKESKKEKDPIKQDKGLFYKGFDNKSEVQFNSNSEAQFENKAEAKRIIIYKISFKVITISFSFIFTGYFYKNAQFLVICNISLLLI
jgi:hypothetical protein